VTIVPKTGRFAREGLLILVLLAILVAGAEWLLGDRAERWAARRLVVEPQSPTMLHIKLDTLARHPGYRVAILGDSVVLGLSLKEHGDPRWRHHSLTPLLQRRLAKEWPNRDVLVMNLGLNGAVPAELALLAQRLAQAKPDLVLCDINLRGFSADFADEQHAVQRAWLKNFNYDGHGRFRQAGSGDAVEDRAASVLVSGSRLFALRDTLQLALLSGGPKHCLEELRSRAVDRLKQEPLQGDGDQEELELLMLARGRYQSVHLSAGHAQRKGLEDLLDVARQANWHFLLFYARENPATLPSLISREKYAALRCQLRDCIKSRGGLCMRYNEGETGVGPEHYLDHVHVDAQGYEKLVETIWPDLRELMACPDQVAITRQED
jgi:lysophospholipase L1-like esterase